jgi:hypothetical protein
VQAEEEERAVQAKYREGEKVGPQKDDSRDR